MSSGDWVKAKDPASGRDFFANRVTRETRWEAPPGFIDPDAPVSTPSIPTSNVYASHRTNSYLDSKGTVTQQQPNVSDSNVNRMTSGFGTIPSGFGVTPIQAPAPAPNSMRDQSRDESGLPPNWEKMTDPTSGRTFYVDHESKVTTWEHPNLAARSNRVSNKIPEESKRGTSTGFGFIPAPASASSQPAPREEPTRRIDHLQPQSMAYAPSHTVTKPYQSSRTYSSTSYTSQNDDFSSKYYNGSGPSAIQRLDFRVTSVADRLRPVCPSCKSPFTMSKRRHHCRLCGDIFCDACSNHRVNLPLEGAQFDRPVRVCDFCFEDVDKGNYFSMRRYLTALQLYDVESEGWAGTSEYSFGDEDETGVRKGEIKANDVAAALSSLAQDLDSVLLDSTSFSEKVTIEASILIPSIARHLELDSTSDRAIRVLGNLLALGNVVGDDSFVLAMYTQPEAEVVWGDILALLEWSGTSTKTLAVQEEAARTLFYLTDPKVFAKILQMDEHGEAMKLDRLCDVPRSFRIMLDHTTSNASASLQRWAAACIRNLVAEDYRRACDAVTEAMTTGNSTLFYESFTPELLSTGGVMILSSLVSSEDGDTRAHAMSALSATITTTRDLNIRLGILKEAYGIDVAMCSTSTIVEAIVASGACGSSLAQLLLSADDSVAMMGCSFASSLVHPIITNPLGSTLPIFHRVSSSGSVNSHSINQDSLSSNRKAALEFAMNDGLLAALIQLVKVPTHRQKTNRSPELRCCATEIIAAISLAVCFWDNTLNSVSDSIEATNEFETVKQQVQSFKTIFEDEHMGEAIVNAYFSASVINTSNDSPALRLREAASLIMASIASCSERAAEMLMQKNVINDLISTAADGAMLNSSARGEYFPRCLPMLEAIASILVMGWKVIQKISLSENRKENDEDGAVRMYNYAIEESSSSVRPSSLDFLLETIDAGIMPLVNRLIESNIDYNSKERAHGIIRVKIACTHIIAAMFGIAQCDNTTIGLKRIYDGVGNESAYQNYGIQDRGRAVQNLLPSTVTLLQSTINEAQQYQSDLPLLRLLEGTILALGSMCGSRFCSFKPARGETSYETTIISTACLPKAKEQFWNQMDETCTTACNALSISSSLPSLLVGALGEGSVIPTLRLALATVENSLEGVGEKLARSGVIVPLSDILKDALSAGDHYTFTACVSLISYCGPHIKSNSGENSGLQSLRESVTLLSNILAIEERPDAPVSRKKTLNSLKKKCILTIERLSTNSSLWGTIVAAFVPCVSKFFDSNDGWLRSESGTEEADHFCAALQVILRVIALPSHATSLSQTNIGDSLCRLLCDEKSLDHTNKKYELMALQVIHSLLSFSITHQGKKDVTSINVNAVMASCCVLATKAQQINSAPGAVDKNGAAITKLGLEIIELVLAQLDMVQSSAKFSELIRLLADNLIKYPSFLRSLCSTMLLLVNEKNIELDIPNQNISIAQSYGPSLILYDGCLDMAVSLLFRISFICSITQEETSESFWDTLLMKDDSDEVAQDAAVVAACAIFLKEIDNETSGTCVPKNSERIDYFQNIELPIVRTQILHGLYFILKRIPCCTSDDRDQKSSKSISTLLMSLDVPQICLTLCNSPKMIDHSIRVLEIILSEYPDALLASIVEDKKSLMALFGLLSTDTMSKEVKTKPEKIRVFAAVSLSVIGEKGLLGTAVQQLGLRSTAIASLCAACLMEDQDSLECLAEDLTGSGLSISEFCLRSLLGVVSVSDKSGDKVTISSAEANAISSALGKKLSEMVLARFVDEANIEQSITDLKGQTSITQSPEVLLLCALASSKEALPHLCAHGGLEALSLIAAEGELSAITALHEASKGDPFLVLSVDGHTSVMQLISSHEDKDFGRDIGSACLNLLTALNETRKGKEKIAGSDFCEKCIDYASNMFNIFGTTLGVKSDDDKNLNLDEHEGEHRSFKTALEISCISFLKSIVSSRKCREMIFRNEKLKASIDSVLADSQSFELQNEVVQFLSEMSRYTRDTDISMSFSVGNLLSSLMTLLKSDNQKRMISETSGTIFGDLAQSHRCNRNLVLSSTCMSLESMIGNMTESNEIDVLNALILQCAGILDFHLAPAKKIAKKTLNSGILMNNIISIFLQFGDTMENQVVMKTENVLSILLAVLLINPFDSTDPLMEEDEINWRCAQTHCLQYLARLATEQTSLEDENRLWEDSILKAEKKVMDSRKAQRLRKKGVSDSDVSVLKIVRLFSEDKHDSTRLVAAKRLLNRLDGCLSV